MSARRARHTLSELPAPDELTCRRLLALLSKKTPAVTDALEVAS